MLRAPLGLAIAVGVALFAIGPRPARGERFSRTDKLRALYSNQLSFDKRGVPLITVGILEGTDRVELGAPTPPRLLPGGPGGPEITATTRWTVELRSARPAEVDHYLVLARASAKRSDELDGVRSAWRERGAHVRVVELGSIYGMRGRVFDNRSLMLCAGPFGSRKTAKKRGERYLARKWLSKVEVISRLRRRPSGVLVATDARREVRLRARDAIWFAPAKRGELLRVRQAGRSGRHFAGHAGGRYRGALYVTIDRHGLLAVVNRLPADQLLAGLISAEIFPSAPAAALRAQAIAARGHMLAKIGKRNLADPYLTCAWQRCQVYRGAGHEHPRTSEAIAATRGLVLTRRESGGLVHAVYHAHSGGFTEDNDNVWPGPPDPALRGRLDAPAHSGLEAFRDGITEQNIRRWLSIRPSGWSARSGVNADKLRWRVRRRADALSRRLRRLGIGKLRAVKVLERGRSGRAKLIALIGSRGRAKVRGELAIRRALGGLRSSMFVVDPVRGDGGAITAFEFLGGGWGHGVGMCQTGAIGMARSGLGYRRILHHYYASSHLRRVY